jgi:hypothetical protein
MALCVILADNQRHATECFLWRKQLLSWSRNAPPFMKPEGSLPYSHCSLSWARWILSIWTYVSQVVSSSLKVSFPSQHRLATWSHHEILNQSILPALKVHVVITLPVYYKKKIITIGSQVSHQSQYLAERQPSSENLHTVKVHSNSQYIHKSLTIADTDGLRERL